MSMPRIFYIVAVEGEQEDYCYPFVSYESQAEADKHAKKQGNFTVIPMLVFDSHASYLKARDERRNEVSAAKSAYDTLQRQLDKMEGNL